MGFTLAHKMSWTIISYHFGDHLRLSDEVTCHHAFMVHLGSLSEEALIPYYFRAHLELSNDINCHHAFEIHLGPSGEVSCYQAFWITSVYQMRWTAIKLLESTSVHRVMWVVISYHFGIHLILSEEMNCHYALGIHLNPSSVVSFNLLSFWGSPRSIRWGKLPSSFCSSHRSIRLDKLLSRFWGSPYPIRRGDLPSRFRGSPRSIR